MTRTAYDFCLWYIITIFFLLVKDPYNVSGQNGLVLNGLSKEQTCLLQRFGPCFANSEKQQNSVFTDTIGFFIAKFYKQL
jgi:hypothetical protein